LSGPWYNNNKTISKFVEGLRFFRHYARQKRSRKGKPRNPLQPPFEKGGKGGFIANARHMFLLLTGWYWLGAKRLIIMIPSQGGEDGQERGAHGSYRPGDGREG